MNYYRVFTVAGTLIPGTYADRITAQRTMGNAFETGFYPERFGYQIVQEGTQTWLDLMSLAA